MSCDQTPDDGKREKLLFVIRDRLERRERPVLWPSEAAELLEWAILCDDREKQAELLSLFRRLGGIEIVRAALSDFD
ncbi:hypothetical protein EI983_10370 [Roseovarius faecimaris]|uniref:Uncharacterized protein n=1 Tax=Roseovarius faecimaris TaxID=2494550 RepID=A0A6I6IRE9_9RHOB|nr:hypothetical protein [Roseovarius faecimaris]QGX98654.1 hypothetical protein EI983_10370 [Roseovarius faecimaris]